MVSGVKDNMPGICWNAQQRTDLFFNLKVVGDRFQNGLTEW